MVHIGIDARLNAYRVGGISTYTRQIIKELEAFAITQNLTVFESRKTQERLSERFAFQKLWTPPHHRYERLALSVELVRHRLNLFHSPDFIPPRFGARHFIITVHDLTFLHYPQYLTADSRRYYNDQIGMATRQASHIFAVSEATQRDLQTLLNVPESKITVHQEGVNNAFEPLLPAQTNPVLEKYGLPKDGYLLHVGTVEPRKNIMGLLKAYENLHQQMADVPPLVLVGRRGWLLDETVTAIEQASRQYPVIWKENVSQQDLPAVYNGALLLVLPSFYEGFGLPALEAMACGVVPLVSNTSSLPEVVGQVGLMFNPHDPESIAEAVKYALMNHSWRSEQAALARQQAQKFSWAKGAETVLHTYQRLLRG